MSFRPGVKQAFPDDMFLLAGGRPLFVEFKAVGKAPTTLQLERLERLNELGYDAIWSDDKDTVCAILTYAMESLAVHGTGSVIFGKQLRGGFTLEARRTKDLDNIGRIRRAARDRQS